MASKETDEFIERPETFIEEAGTSLKAALDICRHYGVVTDSMLPLAIDTLMYRGQGDVFYAVAAQHKAASYFNARLDLDAWRQALANGKPVLVGLSVDNEWRTAAQRNGLLDNFQPRTVQGGHAVCLVGYREDGRFIIRNSWGTSFGDDGFAYASTEYIQQAFFSESYVVTV